MCISFLCQNIYLIISYMSSTRPQGNERVRTAMPGHAKNKQQITESEVTVQGSHIAVVLSQFRQRLLTPLQAQTCVERSDAQLNKLLSYMTAQAHILYKQADGNLNVFLELLNWLQDDEDTLWKRFLLTREHTAFLVDMLAQQEMHFEQIRFRGWSAIERRTPSLPPLSTALSFGQEYVAAEIAAAVKEIDLQANADKYYNPELHPERFFALPKEWAFLALQAPEFLQKVVEGWPIVTKELMVGPNTMHETHKATRKFYPTFREQHMLVTDLYKLHMLLTRWDFFDTQLFTVPKNWREILQYT